MQDLYDNIVHEGIAELCAGAEHLPGSSDPSSSSSSSDEEEDVRTLIGDLRWLFSHTGIPIPRER